MKNPERYGDWSVDCCTAGAVDKVFIWVVFLYMYIDKSQSFISKKESSGGLVF